MLGEAFEVPRAVKSGPYLVKEVMPTIQGEGMYSGHRAVFCRFAGCNVWSGREQDREKASAKGMCALWCDTDFRGTDGVRGRRYATAEELVDVIEDCWIAGLGPDSGRAIPRVVFTGGEPAMQLDEHLVAEAQARGFLVHVETNGSLRLPPMVDWVTLSPKPPMPVVVQRYDELKYVWPNLSGKKPSEFECYSERLYLQPQDPGPMASEQWKANMRTCAAYVAAHPHWTLGIQLHKIVGLP